MVFLSPCTIFAEKRTMMRKLSFILFLLTMTFQVQAQQTCSSEQLQKVRKLLRNPSSRQPLPLMMKSDRDCYDAVFRLEKLDEKQMQLLSDSMKVRYEENEYILPAIKYVVEDTVKRRRTTRDVEYEQLRYKCFAEECGRIEANRKAEQREEPKADLIYVHLSVSGMAYNPKMPMSIEVGEEDYDIGKYGWKETPVKVSKEALKKIQQLFSEQIFYQLHPGYFFKKVNLPTIPMERVLDGEHWSLTFMYADGTRISSSGDIRPKQSLSELEKMLNEFIPDEPREK